MYKQLKQVQSDEKQIFVMRCNNIYLPNTFIYSTRSICVICDAQVRILRERVADDF